MSVFSVLKEYIGVPTSHPIGGAQLKTPIENKKASDGGCGDKSLVREGSQITPESNKHEGTITSRKTVFSPGW
jgi:hypothetical protein